MSAASPEGYKYFQDCLFHSIPIYFHSLKLNNRPLVDYSVSFRRAFQMCIVLSESVILRQYSYHVVEMF